MSKMINLERIEEQVGQHNIKILVADDDRGIREVLEDFLKKEGCQVKTASNGLDMLEKAKSEKFDIIVADLMMPGYEGLEILKSCKQLDPDILFIMVTGYSSLETALSAIKEGAYDYVTKPFRLEEMRIVIKNGAERVNLIRQNRMLVEDLRVAYSEIEGLKKCSCANKGNGANGGKCHNGNHEN